VWPQLSPLVRVMSAPECLRVLFERAFTSEGASSVQVPAVLTSSAAGGGTKEASV